MILIAKLISQRYLRKLPNVMDLKVTKMTVQLRRKNGNIGFYVMNDMVQPETAVSMHCQLTSKSTKFCCVAGQVFKGC